MKFAAIFRRIVSFFETERGKKTLKWGQRTINIAVLGWLLYKLTDIGWIKFWHSLPAVPLFYILFVILFFNYRCLK
jgi:hypothetical protein